MQTFKTSWQHTIHSTFELFRVLSWSAFCQGSIAHPQASLKSEKDLINGLLNCRHANHLSITNKHSQCTVAVITVVLSSPPPPPPPQTWKSAASWFYYWSWNPIRNCTHLLPFRRWIQNDALKSILQMFPLLLLGVWLFLYWFFRCRAKGCLSSASTVLSMPPF